MNNAHLGLVRQQQQLFYGGRYHASRFEGRTDFVAIARGFGIRAIDMESTADPIRVLSDALRESGPCLINVRIASDENVYPMVPPGSANRDMIVGASNGNAAI